MSRKLVIDGEIFQTPAWHRGMGKYSLALVLELSGVGLKNRWDSIEVISSKHLPQNLDVMHKLIQNNKDVIFTELSLLPNETDNPKVILHNRKTIDDYLAGRVEVDIEVDYLILSLMQREICPVFPSRQSVKKLLLAYDLIPLIFHDIYLSDSVVRVDYLTKLAEFMKADRYFAISKTVANDLTLYLGIDKGRIVNIAGGPITHSTKTQKIDIPNPFILMPTGNEPRKNNSRGIQGFGEFNKRYDNKYTLVITSFFEKKEMSQLQALTDNIVFVGNVSGEELDYLYDKAEALLFPSEYEGLGLPILEAVINNKPVVCSDISVFHEMSDTAFHYFNPYSITAISNALSEMVSTPKTDKKSYGKILRTYTWEGAASKVAETTNNMVVSKKKTEKIAVFGSNPQGGHLANIDTLTVHAELSRIFDIEYYFDQRTSVPVRAINFLPYITKTITISPGLSFRETSYDAILYTLGSGANFASTLFAALAIPGIVLLYDLHLEETWSHMVQTNLICKSRLSLEKQIQHTFGNSETGYIVSVISRQKAVVVFSEKDKQAVRAVLDKVGSKTKVYNLHHPNSPPVYPALSPDNDTVRILQSAPAISYRQYAASLARIIRSTHG